MTEEDQEIRRVEDWLTSGRPRTIRTRGSIRTRAATATMHAATVYDIRLFDDLLEQLKAEAPGVPWIVVVDGSVDDATVNICMKLSQTRSVSKFWLVDAGATQANAQRLPPNALRLNSADAGDARILQNLVADLVVAPAEPARSQSERLRRWLPRTRYVLTDGFEE